MIDAITARCRATNSALPDETWEVVCKAILRQVDEGQLHLKIDIPPAHIEEIAERLRKLGYACIHYPDHGALSVSWGGEARSVEAVKEDDAKAKSSWRPYVPPDERCPVPNDAGFKCCHLTGHNGPCEWD